MWFRYSHSPFRLHALTMPFSSPLRAAEGGDGPGQGVLRLRVPRSSLSLIAMSPRCRHAGRHNKGRYPRPRPFGDPERVTPPPIPRRNVPQMSGGWGARMTTQTDPFHYNSIGTVGKCSLARLVWTFGATDASLLWPQAGHRAPTAHKHTAHGARGGLHRSPVEELGVWGAESTPLPDQPAREFVRNTVRTNWVGGYTCFRNRWFMGKGGLSRAERCSCTLELWRVTVTPHSQGGAPQTVGRIRHSPRKFLDAAAVEPRGGLGTRVQDPGSSRPP